MKDERTRPSQKSGEHRTFFAHPPQRVPFALMSCRWSAALPALENTTLQFLHIHRRQQLRTSWCLRLQTEWQQPRYLNPQRRASSLASASARIVASSFSLAASLGSTSTRAVMSAGDGAHPSGSVPTGGTSVQR